MIERESFIWFAVRCCCQPLKVMGFLRLPAIRAVVPDGFEIEDVTGVPHRVRVKAMRQCMSVADALLMQHAIEPVVPVPVQEEELAIYSDDRPIEFWRTIPGFVETKEARP